MIEEYRADSAALDELLAARGGFRLVPEPVVLGATGQEALGWVAVPVR